LGFSDIVVELDELRPVSFDVLVMTTEVQRRDSRVGSDDGLVSLQDLGILGYHRERWVGAFARRRAAKTSTGTDRLIAYRLTRLGRHNRRVGEERIVYVASAFGTHRVSWFVRSRETNRVGLGEGPRDGIDRIVAEVDPRPATVAHHRTFCVGSDGHGLWFQLSRRTDPQICADGQVGKHARRSLDFEETASDDPSCD
jgi:hypothetical protein